MQHRKIKRTLILCMVLWGCLCCNIFAQEKYPIEKDEKVLDIEVLSEQERYLYVQAPDTYVFYHVHYGEDGWRVIKKEVIEAPLGGLREAGFSDIGRLWDSDLTDKLGRMGVDIDHLPNRIDYADSPYLPTPGKQFEDSCVGWATGYYLRTYQEAWEQQWSPRNQQHRIFSPSFIYNQINEGVDEGSTLSDAGKLLKDVGAATLADFPYVPGDYLTQPTKEVMAKASEHRIRDFRILYTRLDNPEYIIRKTKEYLATGDLPVVGIKIGLKWRVPYIDENGNSIITTESYKTAGHAVTVVGYDDDLVTPEGKGAFKIVNSYGTDWGNGGFSYVTYPSFVQSVIHAMVFTDIVSEISLPLSFNIEEMWNFDIHFGNNGFYDFNIRDKNTLELLNKKQNLSAVKGSNVVYWDGKNQDGENIPYGEYMIEILNKKKVIFQTDFIKETVFSEIMAEKKMNKGTLKEVLFSLRLKKAAMVEIRQKNRVFFQEKLSENVLKEYVISADEIVGNDEGFTIKILQE